MKHILRNILPLTAATGLIMLILSGCAGDNAAEEATFVPAADIGHDGFDPDPAEPEQAMAGSSIDTAGVDWCREHLVPESECTKCDQTLIQKFKETGDWCASHGLPESHCRICNPEIRFPQEEIPRSGGGKSTDGEIEVSLYFRPNASECATDGAYIQFASANTAERTGLTVQTARGSRHESIIEAPAEVVFDETEAVVIASIVPALVSRWLVSPGDVVREGQALAVLQSSEITRLESTLISACAAYEVELKELERHQEMIGKNLISQADFDRQQALTEQARAEFVSARSLLLSAGLDDSDIDEIASSGNLSNRFALHSPARGIVIERVARLGQLLEAGKALAVLADPTSMWIEARLTEEQLKNVEVGGELIFESDGRGLNRVGGEIIWVSRFLDPDNRTGIVRAKVIDPNHELHAGEFGRAKIVQEDGLDVVLVPKDAVQWEGCCNVVFVKETIQRYRPRKVRFFDGDGPFYQIASGVEPGEEVVVDGAFLLKTELKKSSIGAGCCSLEPVG